MSDKYNNSQIEDGENLENIEEVSDSENLSADSNLDLEGFSREQLLELAANLRAQLVEAWKSNDEITALCKRIQADFDNYRKRNNENLKNIRQDAAIDVVESFVPTLDIVDQALTLIKDEQVASGIKMMRRQLMEVFASSGVCEIDALGQDFDPKLHEAVLSEPNEEQSGKVLEVLRKGYKMGDRVIRYAAVKVAN